METQRYRLRIYRYKQGWDRARFQIFELQATPQTTVLEALQTLRREQDPSLTFRYSCYHASCGTCGLRINGREALACLTRLGDLRQPITLQPLANLPVISDLVVDMGAFYRRYGDLHPPLIRSSEYPSQAPAPPGVDRYTRLESCIECGLCVSACPVVASDPFYLGPAALAAAWRLVQEPRGYDPTHVLHHVDTEHGCWRCHVAMECSDVCPLEVDPAGAIAGLRRTLLRRRLWPWRNPSRTPRTQP